MRRSEHRSSPRAARTGVIERPRRAPDGRRPVASKTVSLRRRAFNLITDWRFFTLLGLSLTGGLTALSIAFIFKMPAVPNCPSVFWPLASASLRLHCAQLAASKETVPDLLEAIDLLNTLGKDHPLYKESSRLIEDWSAQILDLAEQDFQAGKIKSAIAGARQIPQDSAAAKLVDDRIKRWEKIWSKAQKIYNQAGEVLKKANLQDAQVFAARLLSIDNEYWQTTKYDQLNKLILSTRKDITRLGKAERALKRSVVDDIVASLQEISGILKQSFVHKDAQVLIPKLGRRLMDLAEAALDRRDYSTALDIANRIPGNVNLGKEVDDFRWIAQAQSKAWAGGGLNLEDAIADAEKIKPGRPSYDKAQRLIGRWQVEIRELARLDQAKKLAQAGDLQNAIAQAAQLSQSNQAAQDFLRETTGQVQDKQDRPILDQAEQSAIYGDAASLESAIAQAKKIGPDRSLYREARNRIKMWSGQLQGLRDQAAAQQAVIADTSTAADVQPVVTPESVELPTEVAAPSPEEAALRNERATLEQARNIASAGTPDALMQAIGMVQTVPDASPVRSNVLAAIDQWSQQMVQSAQYQAEFDVPGAIAIVQRVPPGTSGYADAQAFLARWRTSIGQ
ncbi:hypothetical protein [Romeriopsis navalis]|uniref:hypothetical protein n=1 Tax=Romeriopsis navalis TaxID=2992132 RepID=UPI0021F81F39|nr:hypothetical protein [Romeriopsis navalis]